MNRLRKIAIVVGLFAFLLSSAAAEAGIFRRCRHRSGQQQSACKSCYQEASMRAQICRAVDMMHHDGFCDYYSLICPGNMPVLWQGAHGLPVGGCNVPASCVSQFMYRGRGDVKDDGYKRTIFPNRRLEWDPTPRFTNTATHMVKQSSVQLKYVKYTKQHTDETVFAQVIDFEYSVDSGTSWTPFTVAFEISEREPAQIPDDLRRARKGKEHTHDVGGLEILTNHQTKDNP